MKVVAGNRLLHECGWVLVPTPGSYGTNSLEYCPNCGEPMCSECWLELQKHGDVLLMQCGRFQKETP